MSSLPPRDNRMLQAVDALKKEILAQRISGLLPGERELAQRLAVSRKTMRKAVAQLEREQWLSPAEPGRRRKILKAPLSGTQGEELRTLEGRSVVIMAPRPLNQMGTTERYFQSCLNRRCEKLGISLMHRHLDVRHMKRPAYRLQEFTLQNPADLYLLQHSSLPIQQWFASEEKPCLVLGDRWVQFGLPSVAGDMAATAIHAAALLQRHNHHRVAMLYPDPGKRGLEIFAQRFPIATPDIELNLIRHEETAESINAAVSRLLTTNTPLPSAVITPTVFSTVSVISVAGKLGLRIPEDISLLCLSHDTLFNYTQPNIAGYEFKMEPYAKAVYKSLTDLLLHPRSLLREPTLVLPEFVSGGSIGTAP